LSRRARSPFAKPLPNPRLQRTRLRSPLSRQPLGRMKSPRLVGFGAIALGVLVACINQRAFRPTSEWQFAESVSASSRDKTEGPVLLIRPEVTYPPDARRRGASGCVDLLVRVDADGRVTQVDVAKFLDHQLDEAARGVYLPLRYSPARLNGKPYASVIKAQVCYRLQ
jgi:TonB family protein